MGSRVLVIGGTGFVGRHLVTACRSLGHEVTVFNRGLRTCRLPVDVRRIVGDRRDLGPDARAQLAATWDIVIDTCAYVADDMALVQALLSGQSPRYVLLSTCGVYQGAAMARIPDERAPVIGLHEADGSASGKLNCERLALAMAPTALVVRLGMVTGPGDPSGRLTYWIERCLRGGDLLVPAAPAQSIQFADVRDVAVFVAAAADAHLDGVVNVAGESITFEDLLGHVRRATHGRPRLRWVPEEIALRHGVRPWQELPLWLPAADPRLALMRTGTDRAVRAGFRARPVRETVRDTVCWYQAHRSWHDSWLALHRERAIIADLGE